MRSGVLAQISNRDRYRVGVVAKPSWPYFEQMSDFTHNHYVPEWYQKRFLAGGEGKYYYLDLRPEKIVTPNGHTYTRNSVLHWGPSSCFAQDDLYTMQWGALKNTEIEQFFSGTLIIVEERCCNFLIISTLSPECTKHSKI
jgi:hypothetical protein